jgi:hypothetical protein
MWRSFATPGGAEDDDLSSPLLPPPPPPPPPTFAPPPGGGGGHNKGPPSPRPSTVGTAMTSSRRSSSDVLAAPPPPPPFDPDYYHDYDVDYGDLDADQEEYEDDEKCCFRCYCRLLLLPSCAQFFKSLFAVLLSAGGVASSVFAILASAGLGGAPAADDDASHPPDRDPATAAAANAWMYAMATIAILVSIRVIWNEASFLRGDRRIEARRKGLVILSLRRRTLMEKNGRLEMKIDELEADARRYDAASSRLRTIAESQNFDMDDVVKMVNENEATLDHIRENIRLGVIMDVAKIIVNDADDDHLRGGSPRRRIVVDAAWANRVSDEVKAKIWKDHGAYLDERNFLCALATYSTNWGALRSMEGLLLNSRRRRRRLRRAPLSSASADVVAPPPAAGGDDDDDDDDDAGGDGGGIDVALRDGLLSGVVGRGDDAADYDDDDDDDDDDDARVDAFLLPNEDRRQAGSVDVARARLAGETHTSLTPEAGRRRRRRRRGGGGGGGSSGGHRRLPAVVVEDDEDYDRDDDGSTPSSSHADATTEKKARRGGTGGNTLRGQLRQFWSLSFPYFRESREGRFLFGILFVNCLCYNAISVFFSYLFRDFYTALAEKEVQTFYGLLRRFLISLIFLIPLQVRVCMSLWPVRARSSSAEYMSCPRSNDVIFHPPPLLFAHVVTGLVWVHQGEARDRLEEVAHRTGVKVIFREQGTASLIDVCIRGHVRNTLSG